MVAVTRENEAFDTRDYVFRVEKQSLHNHGEEKSILREIRL